MKKNLTLNMGIIVSMATLMLAIQANAVDQAAAAANLAEIATISVQSKANLASASLGGDIEAIAEAGKRSDAVDAAMAQGQEAHAAMERAVANGDEDAAQSAMEDLQASKEKANDALGGVIPDALAQSVHNQWKEGQTNTGGGPGKAYDAPNIYDVPWQTQGMRTFYQGLWGNLWASGRTGGGFGDKDATPEQPFVLS